jgi:CRP/FNR family transcriptional regulator
MTKGIERRGHIVEMAAGRSSPDLDYLFSEGRSCHFGAGDNIITEGEPTTYVYDLLNGTVALSRNGRDGRRQILAFMGARQFLGASSTPGYPNLAVALTSVDAIRYPRSALEKALNTTPEFASNFRMILTRILESSHDHVYTIGQRSAIERLASFLLYLRANQARFSEDGPRDPSEYIDLPMTRLDIADFLGLTIETVSRAFSALKEKNLVAFTDSHSCEILEIDKIRELGGREDFTDRRGQA